MAGNGHARRLDRIEAELPPVRPSVEVLEAEYDKLIDAYERHQTGEPGVSLASKWPIEDMDRWVRELIEEAAHKAAGGDQRVDRTTVPALGWWSTEGPGV